MTFRIGSKVGRTIYLDDELCGVMDTRELAAQVVQALNGFQLALDEVRALKHTVIYTIGGVDYEGNPTCELNYLQRLRILIEKEKRLEKLQREFQADQDAQVKRKR